jgi:outer membrane protein W
VRYADIETKAKLDGAGLGTVKIEPMIYGAHIGFRF